MIIVFILVGEYFNGGQTGGETGRATNETRRLNTNAWRTRGELSMRRENDGSTGGLLLKHSVAPTIYRYEPADHALRTVDFAEWQSSTSPIASCVEQFSPDPRRLKINSDAEGKLVDASGRAIPTAGTFATMLLASPDHKRAAVLSANGPKSHSLLPFLGGPQPLGQRYHQVISTDDFKWAGTAVALPVEDQSDLLTPCWTADEKYVVYYDAVFYYLLAVPVT